MSNSRPDSVKDIERACRRRRQNATDQLRRALEGLPVNVLQQLLMIADPGAVIGRRGLSQAQVYGIAAVIVNMYVTVLQGIQPPFQA